MKKVLLIDFDDSFTHNLKGLFFNGGNQVECLHWKSYLKQNIEQLKQTYDLFIFGPGPGHPNEYDEVLKSLPSLEDKKVLGVCLGHQILLTYLKGELFQLEEPLHGQSLELNRVGDYLSINGFKAQFYNSWAVNSSTLAFSHDSDTHVIDNGKMTVLFKKNNWLGTQFHPESVGTTCPERVVEQLLIKLGV
jgi:anthranilate/para-aminobenzoate synthase component II